MRFIIKIVPIRIFKNIFKRHPFCIYCILRYVKYLFNVSKLRFLSASKPYSLLALLLSSKAFTTLKKLLSSKNISISSFSIYNTPPYIIIPTITRTIIKIAIPILRSTGVISNPQNPARTTPAGPPLETFDSQMLCKNNAEFYVFFGNQRDFEKVLGQVYNYVIT